MTVRLVAVLSLAMAAFMVPQASAHMTASGCHESADELCHMTLTVKDLAPGDEHVYSLHSERVEGDFPAGWIVTAFAGIQGEGEVRANLSLDNDTKHEWTWSGNTFSSNSTRITEKGHYELGLHNLGSQNVRYAFYFDQSCNCAMKVIPINGGFVLFNYDLPADREVRLGFPTIDGWHVKGSLAVLEDDRGRWPDDFRILDVKEQKNKGWLQFEFQTEQATTYYVFVEAPAGVKQGPDGRPMPVELTPLLEVEDKEAPGLGGMALALFMLGLALLRRRD